jgi:hypothetical protein
MVLGEMEKLLVLLKEKQMDLQKLKFKRVKN